MKTKCFLFLIAVLNIFYANAQNQEKVENLKTFAKAYGYVKYFHPSDEGAQIDWNKLSIYGAAEIENCNTKDEVISTLNELFNPIAPSAKFVSTETKSAFDFKAITPENKKKYQLTYWQHNGVSIGMNHQYGAYRSVRVNRTEKKDQSSSIGNIMTWIDATKYLGKEIKYSGWVKLKEGTEGTGHLWFRVDKSNKTMGFFENMKNNPIKETNWMQYEILGKVDSLATRLVFGCFLKGKGSLYLDDISLHYKQGKEWIEIPITNSNFETEPIGEKKDKAKWIYAGKGYLCKTYNHEHYEGKKSALIEYLGAFETMKGKKVFDYQPEFGELIENELGNGIYCQIPLVLYCNKECTYPEARVEDIDELKEKLENSDISAKILSLRLGNAINVYNVFQHFYPYFDVVDVDWDRELEKALLRSFADKTENDHLITLQKFTAPLKDGHIRVAGGSIGAYVPPVSWEWIENQLVVTKVSDSNSKINVGDIITHVNGKTSQDFFKEVNSRISAGTAGWLNYRARTTSLLGEKDSELTVTKNNKSIRLIRDIDLYKKGRVHERKETHKLIDGSIIYLNLGLIEMDTIKKLLPHLEKSKAIICDLRGYPNGNHEFITYLLTSDDTTSGWMQIPQIIYPDHNNISGYEKHNWIKMMKRRTPYLGGKVIFLIDGRAISYAESYMGYIEGYKLAIIVGQPTAGTNGNVNRFRLPGGYTISWTGMKVLKHNGSQHHGIGILPNVYVNKTILAIREGKDEFLEKAIEIAKQNSH